jgi:hypothetical protein
MASRKRPRTTNHGDGSRDASDTGNSHGSSHSLSSREIQLARAVLKVVNNMGSMELNILELMDKHSFSLPCLKELLIGEPVTPFSITLSQRLINF